MNREPLLNFQLNQVNDNLFQRSECKLAGREAFINKKRDRSDEEDVLIGKCRLGDPPLQMNSGSLVDSAFIQEKVSRMENDQTGYMAYLLYLFYDLLQHVQMPNQVLLKIIEKELDIITKVKYHLIDYVRDNHSHLKRMNTLLANFSIGEKEMIALYLKEKEQSDLCLSLLNQIPLYLNRIQCNLRMINELNAVVWIKNIIQAQTKQHFKTVEDLLNRVYSIVLPLNEGFTPSNSSSAKLFTNQTADSFNIFQMNGYPDCYTGCNYSPSFHSLQHSLPFAPKTKSNDPEQLTYSANSLFQPSSNKNKAESDMNSQSNRPVKKAKASLSVEGQGESNETRPSLIVTMFNEIAKGNKKKKESNEH